jgi:hypothetical protein
MTLPPEQDQWSGDENRNLDNELCECGEERSGPNDTCPACDGPQDDSHIRYDAETIQERYERAAEQKRELRR